MAKKKQSKSVETIKHEQDTRTNIPSAEHQSVMGEEERTPKELRYPRNTDLDPQLVWRGKDEQDWSDLIVQAPPLYIQEKVHPKVLIDDLRRETKEREEVGEPEQIDLFADFNGMNEDADKTEFYQHEQNWTNRMILGDSLQVMASLAEREELRGKVQCIYLDPPYGIKFNSNFQWSTTSRDVKDGKKDHITREPEQVKAFRDTWRDGIHSYLTYLRDRLTVARDLLRESGSIFVQIGDENVHRVRALMDEVFGAENFKSEIKFKTTGGHSSAYLPSIADTVLWFGKTNSTKYRTLYLFRRPGDEGATQYTYGECRIDNTRGPLSQLNNKGISVDRIFQPYPMVSMGSIADDQAVNHQGVPYHPNPGRHWSVKALGTERIASTGRVYPQGKNLRFVYYLEDYPVTPLTNLWNDTQTSGFSSERLYVVQTLSKVIQRCILMTTDPGDLVLDPTCGSGTTAYVAEQWGRRWITVDTSRVALALARARIMGARYPYYLLADSPEGQQKEAEISRREFVPKPTYRNIRHGFVYERVPHITLKSIANNSEIDVIYEKHQPEIEAALAQLNAALRGHKKPYRVESGGRKGKDVRFDAPEGEMFTMPSGEQVPTYELVEWEVPREAPEDWPKGAHAPLEEFWKKRIARQKEIDASIAAKADHEYLYDRPYEDKSTVRVAGPFTVESLSPHRVMGVDENDELIDPQEVAEKGGFGEPQSFEQMILENLKLAGVQQAHKEDRITFESVTGWPGDFICGEGRYFEGETEKRAGIFIGPEFGTVTRPDLVDAAREAADAGFDTVIACAFNYEAHASEFHKLGRIPILKARMNADLHMSGELKNTGSGNLFVIFGEPDIDVYTVDSSESSEEQKLQVKIHGVDVFDPSNGEVRSDNADGIACWFIDTDYNGESFFVRHAYFLGTSDPYKSLKSSLKSEISEEAWETLHSDTSRPFSKPASGRIAVKVINHLGDEVMKVFRV